jgi:hypothetical protein
MINSKFKIGDSVRIINDGNIYTTYYRMFSKLGFKDTELNATLPYGIGKVFGIDVHENNSNDILIAIRDEYGNECLIDECGLKHEFDMTTNEGRLAYAKKHYPIGTVIKSIHTDTKLKLTSEPRIYFKTTIISKSDDRGIDVYHAGVWAKIIEGEQQEEIIMETQRLTRQGLKEIHSVACSNWKGKLEGMSIRNTLEDYIELTQEEVNAMFGACTKDQLPIVSKYLKQDDGSVDVKKLDFKDNHIIARRNSGEYKDKAFWLTTDYDWILNFDNEGFLCLIPTKKK